VGELFGIAEEIEQNAQKRARGPPQRQRRLAVFSRGFFCI
jgi:hypothetical protein